VREFFSFSGEIEHVDIRLWAPLDFFPYFSASCFFFLYVLVAFFFSLLDLYFELHCDFGLWLVVAVIQWRRGGRPTSHSKIPRLSRLRFSCRYGFAHQFVWHAEGFFFCLFRSSVCRIRILFQMCCVGDCHYVK
jgi:hypothetical protein